MNPFDWRGPAFLAFYVVVSAIGLSLLYRTIKASPRPLSGDARRLLRDPYLLAYLRASVQETLRIVAFSLNQRKLLTITGSNFIPLVLKESLEAVRHPLEAAVLSRCSGRKAIHELFDDSHLRLRVEAYAEPLRASGLVADDEEMGRRRSALLLIGGLLLAIGLTKLALAIHRGHSNIAFLIILTMIVLILALHITMRRRTGAGDRALRDQQTLMMRLKDRAYRLAADGATNEAVLVAAAFGLGALPSTAYPFAGSLKSQAQTGSSCSASYSCSSSSSDSSCGGGGCGGGCGGCGS